MIGIISVEYLLNYSKFLQTLLVLIILRNCIRGIIRETEVLHEDMQFLQLGGDVGCSFYTYFLYFLSPILTLFPPDHQNFTC